LSKKQNEESNDKLATQEPAGAITTFDADFAADAEQYQDDYNKDDFAIPFLQVIQSNSPAAEEGGPKYIDGAKAGMLVETASKTLHDVKKKPLILIPSHYIKKFIVWRLREEGGGFVAEFDYAEGLKLKGACTPDEKGRLINEDGNQLVETAQFSVIIISEDGPRSALFPLTSTQLKAARAWNTAIDGLRIEHKGKRLRPPMFYMSYSVTTVPEKNDKGSWQGLKITAHKPVTELEEGETYYNAAKVLRDGVESGQVSTAKSAAADNPDAEPSTETKKTPF
jgi:hypothetical protein